MQYDNSNVQNSNSYPCKPISPLTFNDPLLSDNYKPKEEIISIFVYQPNIKIRHIKLNIHSKVSILSKIYPIDSIYIYHGLIIEHQKTFLDYNIQKDNKIVMISSYESTQKPELIDKWVKITKDKENFENRMYLNIDQNSRKELARLRDIKSFKSEMMRKRFGKIHRLLLNPPVTDNYSPNCKQCSFNLDYAQSDEPSTSPLPIVW